MIVTRTLCLALLFVAWAINDVTGQQNQHINTIRNQIKRCNLLRWEKICSKQNRAVECPPRQWLRRCERQHQQTCRKLTGRPCPVIVQETVLLPQIIFINNSASLPPPKPDRVLNVHWFMTSSTKENVFFSHTALQLAFKMLRQITNGATSSEIETALQVDRYDSQQLTGQPTEGYMIGIFNGIFLKSPAKSFKRNINSRLGSIEAIDQEHFPQQLKFINSRIARETDNKIIDPVHIEDYIELDKPNKVVSINAAVLSAQWEFPFQSQKTKPREFYGIEKQLIDFMQFDKIRLPYANLESQKIDAQMLLMPFLRTTRNLKMMILLPSKKSNPAVIVSGQMAFFGKSLVQIAKLAKYTDLEVQIPKFEYKCDVELVPDILDDLNIRNIYQEGKADFSPISESPNLALSSMRHITYIQFNEHGINIDNVKKQTLNDVASLGGSIIQFHANRPFFFAILDDNEIYFTGQFENSS